MWPAKSCPCSPTVDTDRTFPDEPYLLRLVRLVRESVHDTSRHHSRLAAELVDAVGCMVRGADHPIVRRVAASLPSYGPATGPIRSMATGTWCPLEHAVLIDALACHVDEFDSIHGRSATVPAAVVVAPTMAMSTWLGATGGRLLDALTCGYDVLTSVSSRFGGASLYGRSWWPTSTFGALGGAAAAGVLLELDDDALAHAFGIAASSVGGLLSDDRFGEGHYLSGARAAVQGAQAALGAAAGMTASWTLLDDPAARAFPGLIDESAEPATGSVAECEVKWYPVARPLHGVIEGLRELRESGIDLRSVTGLEIALHPDLLRFVSAETSVAGPAEAAASAAYALCATAAGRESDPGFYRDAHFDWSGPLPQVSLVAGPTEPFSWRGRLSCTVAGRTVEVVGTPSVNPDAARLRAKFLGNAAAGGLEDVAATALFDALHSVASATDLNEIIGPFVDRRA